MVLNNPVGLKSYSLLKWNFSFPFCAHQLFDMFLPLMVSILSLDLINS